MTSTAPAHCPDLGTALAAWFTATARPLPWRSPDRTAWGVLVSEVMSQQTPVARVAPIWLDWMDRWPTPQAFAQAPTAEVLRAWGSLGYPRRALRLQECARVIVDQYGGEVPADEQALLALPGIGTYTAAAVMAFAFGRRSVVVDTNVRRVLARTVGGEALPSPSLTAAEMSRAAALVPADDASAALWAASSMELGAVVCTARAPRCDDCPVTALCAWRAAGYPADPHAARRRSQAWAGTDRQVRGKVMGALRAAHGPVPSAVIDLVWPDATQLSRCIAGLVEDGLIAQTGEAYHLPVEVG
ncbi:A/G-specific DNA-adenine glycosylase [Sanguibacter gelidistatuariae]|uniref:Adenine DNA glycosylase n=1 Tax=Sanguibacter gelidistatuariae TaxID=1814289 RepID=A0A1G6Y4N9_9MICO|nr:A/G-specific adenine glycosylase [Sanguibacter gelidistatuariae]SDD85454.1 A/G-specific DNA-adenine glycosylase [Sanguibacter gelidistatuariae]